MKKSILLSFVGGILAMGCYFLSQNLEPGFNEVLAETDTSAAAADCTDPTASAAMPEVAYTVTWSAPTAGSAATPSATSVLTGGVNSDSDPTVTATLNATGAPAGSVTLVNTTPVMKLSGLQCQAISQAQLQVHGDGSDNANYDIAVQNLADANNIYTSADKVDDATSGAKDVLFGLSGQITTSNLTDGSDEDSTSPNGEISFGSTTESKGGSELHIMVDVTNYNVQAGTDVETLTFTFTGT